MSSHPTPISAADAQPKHHGEKACAENRPCVNCGFGERSDFTGVDNHSLFELLPIIYETFAPTFPNAFGNVSFEIAGFDKVEGGNHQANESQASTQPLCEGVKAICSKKALANKEGGKCADHPCGCQQGRNPVASALLSHQLFVRVSFVGHLALAMNVAAITSYAHLARVCSIGRSGSHE